LAEEGFVDGQNIQITKFNAENDRATAIAIAKDVVSRDFDLILTVSTAMLQAVANANKETARTHVFSITTDPWGAGVGVSRDNPSVHPPYMTGYGSLQPVDALFRLAREAKPDLNKVGVVWNPSEANSEASTIMARRICKELDIELIEVTVDSSAVAKPPTPSWATECRRFGPVAMSPWPSRLIRSWPPLMGRIQSSPICPAIA
jgi:ABC-type uncharacterized transport system substrate-binding protein